MKYWILRLSSLLFPPSSQNGDSQVFTLQIEEKEAFVGNETSRKGKKLKTSRVPQMAHTDHFTSPTTHKELPITILMFCYTKWVDSQGSPDIHKWTLETKPTNRKKKLGEDRPARKGY